MIIIVNAAALVSTRPTIRNRRHRHTTHNSNDANTVNIDPLK